MRAVCPATYDDNNATASCGSNLEGDSCTAGCISGYSGTLSLACGSNGAWAVTNGACIKRKCAGYCIVPVTLAVLLVGTYINQRSGIWRVVQCG